MCNPSVDKLMKQLHELTDTLYAAPTSTPPPLTMPLFRGNLLAAIAVYQSKGSTTDSHIHAGKHEWIGVIYGQIKIVFEDDGSEVVLEEFDTCLVGPERSHYVVAMKDSLTWAITIPPDEHYPFPRNPESTANVVL